LPSSVFTCDTDETSRMNAESFERSMSAESGLRNERPSTYGMRAACARERSGKPNMAAAAAATAYERKRRLLGGDEDMSGSGMSLSTDEQRSRAPGHCAGAISAKTPRKIAFLQR